MKNKLTKLQDGETYLEINDPVSASVFMETDVDGIACHPHYGYVWSPMVCSEDPDWNPFPTYIPIKTVKEIIEHQKDEPCIAVDGNGFPYFGPASWTNKDGTHHNLPLFHLNLITITHGDTELIKEIIGYEK